MLWQLQQTDTPPCARPTVGPLVQMYKRPWPAAVRDPCDCGERRVGARGAGSPCRRQFSCETVWRPPRHKTAKNLPRKPRNRGALRVGAVSHPPADSSSGSGSMSSDAAQQQLLLCRRLLRLLRRLRRLRRLPASAARRFWDFLLLCETGAAVLKPLHSWMQARNPSGINTTPACSLRASLAPRASARAPRRGDGPGCEPQTASALATTTGCRPVIGSMRKARPATRVSAGAWPCQGRLSTLH